MVLLTFPLHCLLIRQLLVCAHVCACVHMCVCRRERKCVDCFLLVSHFNEAIAITVARVFDVIKQQCKLCKYCIFYLDFNVISLSCFSAESIS